MLNTFELSKLSDGEVMNVVRKTISADPHLWKHFEEFCDFNGYSISKRIMVLIKGDLTKNAK